MLIKYKQLKGLPIVTESGKEIGRLEDLIIETDSQSVLNYVVKPTHLFEGLIRDSLIINRGQVIDISDKKIIVQDNFPKVAVFQKLNKIIDKKKLLSLTKNN